MNAVTNLVPTGANQQKYVNVVGKGRHMLLSRIYTPSTEPHTLGVMGAGFACEGIAIGEPLRYGNGQYDRTSAVRSMQKLISKVSHSFSYDIYDVITESGGRYQVFLLK